MVQPEPPKTMKELTYTTYDHPEANGRSPVPGEQEYQIKHTLEDGTLLTLRMGRLGWETLTNLMIDMLSEAPSHDDGSLNGKDQP
jgi:hypothetical protein